ncbi:MAG TPA: TolC family protein [Spirochaetota bacterium]|nr:TolC family protein [Spirochaetota bacterium]HPK43458.1 TolC family protein [Spirochaetota bacterium]
MADSYANASLSDCLQIALQNNISIKIAFEEVNGALSNVKITKGSNNIQVNGELRTIEILKSDAANSSFNVPGKDTLIGLFIGASATYKLYDANKSNYEQLKFLEYNLAILSALKIKNNVMRDVKITYYQLLLAKKKSELLEKLVKSFEIKYLNAEQLFTSGQRTMVDVSKAQVDLTNARLKYERAQNDATKIKSTLVSLMGMQSDGFDIDTAGFDINNVVKELPYNYDELLQLALLYSFDIKSAEINQELSKTQINIEKDKRLPQLNVVASLGYENREIQNGSFSESLSDRGNWKPTFHAGVSANFPIYTSGVVSSSIDRAMISYNKAIYNVKTVTDSITSNIKSYYTTINDIKIQLDIAQQLIDNAKKYLDLVQKNYDIGIITQNELQDAELNYIQANIDYMQIITDYYVNFHYLISLLCIDENTLFSKGAALK